MKTLFADEVMVALGTGTQAFGLLTPSRSCKVWRIAQEDPKNEERKRIKALLAARGITEQPKTLAFSIHKAISLDNEKWQQKIIGAIKTNGFQVVIIDPIRRFSFKSDKGPAEVSELTNCLRGIIVETGVAIIVIHHDIKPPIAREDQRRRGHRASGGDWFSACESPIHFEKLSKDSTLVVPEDFKFCSDPAPFSFRFTSTEDSIRLVGQFESESNPENLALQQRIIDFLKNSPLRSGSAIAKGIRGGKDAVLAMLKMMHEKGLVDSAPGKKGAQNWFLSTSEEQ